MTQMGVCPAVTDFRRDGLNGGKNGGRVCYTIPGTLCGGKIQGIYASKKEECRQCRFYRLVEMEEGAIHEKSNGILVLNNNPKNNGR